MLHEAQNSNLSEDILDKLTSLTWCNKIGSTAQDVIIKCSIKICVYKQMELLEQPNSKLLTNLGITGIAKLIRRGCSYNIGHKVHH